MKNSNNRDAIIGDAECSAYIREQQFKAMTSLSEMLAHELRTPLISVQSSASSVRNDMLELLKGYAYYAEHCPDLALLSVSRMQRLERALDNMEQSLRYATTTIRTIWTGLHTVVSDDVEMVSFDVGVVVLEAVNRYPMSDADRALIHFTTSEQTGLMGVGDVEMFVHVLHNLLKNGLHAIKEADKGKIIIRLQKKEDKIVIYFEDTALGIDAEHVAKVFDPFYTTKKQSASSIGLGLYFCKRAMEKMGGHISCVAELGRYTCFEICMKAL